jgi:pimeloyl-ACP methyl ester carboxylesterase
MKKLVPRLIGGYLNTAAMVSPSFAGKKGYNIFCTPLAPKVKPHHLEFLNTSKPFTFESAGVKLKAYRWGDGQRKVLFLHGWQSHTFRWRKYIEALIGEAYSIYAFDAPAHGQSGGKYANIPIYSDAIRAFLDRIGPVDVVVSHSMGSFSMLHALYNQPLQVGKLVIMGAPGEANDFIHYYKGLTGLNDRTFGYILNHFKKTLRQSPDYFSAPRFASGLSVPGLIIHDKEDREAPYHHAVRIHDAWKTSQLVTTEGLGHNLQSKTILKMVKEFVALDKRVEEIAKS